MVKVLFLLVACCVFGHAQYQQGQVVYKAKFTGSLNLSNSYDQYLNTLVPAINQIQYQLNFNKEASFFAPIKALASDFKANKEQAFIIAGKHSYFTHPQKPVLAVKEVFGQQFLVIQKQVTWQLQKETKKVGAFTCQKAVATRVIDNGIKINNQKIIAWYATSIPVSKGPKSFGGLPGLILELTQGDITYYATGITFGNTAVPAYPNGSTITQKALDKQLKKYAKENFGYQ